MRGDDKVINTSELNRWRYMTLPTPNSIIHVNCPSPSSFLVPMTQSDHYSGRDMTVQHRNGADEIVDSISYWHTVVEPVALNHLFFSSLAWFRQRTRDSKWQQQYTRPVLSLMTVGSCLPFILTNRIVVYSCTKSWHSSVNSEQQNIYTSTPARQREDPQDRQWEFNKNRHTHTQKKKLTKRKNGEKSTKNKISHLISLQPHWQLTEALLWHLWVKCQCFNVHHCCHRSIPY